MKTLAPALALIINLAKANKIAARRFDSRLGGGIGLNEFIILHSLSQAENERMRRIDLAEYVGLTASGITRLLAPMEKIGLIKREAHEGDARVSYVALASGGRTILSERIEKAELLAGDAMLGISRKSIKELSELLHKMGGLTG